MTVRLLTAWNGFPANTLIADAANEPGLVAAKLADTVLTGGVTYTAPTDLTTYSGQRRVDADYVIKASDDGATLACTTALTITLPLGLAPRPRLDLIAPPTGNLSVAVSGGARVNGATTTLTFTRETSPTGVKITPYENVDGYGAGVYGGGSASTAALAPVSLSANTALTRAAHYNRLIVVDVTAGNVTLTATGTDALLGDFISVDVIGGGSNTVTLAGVTAQSGYQLTAISGGNVEARCDVAASFIASTRTISAGGAGSTATLALVDGDFTSNNLNLTATHTNRVLDCSAVTIPVTLTIQTDASGGYDTTAAELKVLGSLTAPVAIIKGTGATLVGEVQVIEQGAWGGARRKGTDAWAIVGQRKSGLSLGSSLSQFGMCMPRSAGGTSIDSFGMQGASAIDSSTASSTASTDGNAEYGTLKRVRYTSTAATGKCAGVSNGQTFRLETTNSQFPMVFRAGVADAVASMPWVMGITSNISYGTTIASTEPSAGTTDMVVLARDSTDANMQIMHNDNVGAATKIDLGASFPASQFVGYELTLYKNNAGTAYIAVAKNMNTQATVAKVLTSNLPRADRNYYIAQTRSTLAQATAVALDFIGVTLGASS